MRKSLATILFSIMLPLAATSEAEIVARNTQLDVTGDGIADIVVKQCTDCGSAPNRLEHLNSSFRDSIYYGTPPPTATTLRVRASLPVGLFFHPSTKCSSSKERMAEASLSEK